MTTLRSIDSKQVELALVASRAVPATRWAAMSAHVHTQECRPPLRDGGGTYQLRSPSLLSPMNRGDWHCVLRRLEYRGPRAIRKAFGVGIRAMRAEGRVMKRGAA